MDHHTSSVPIRLFSRRSPLYKIGYFLIIISFLMYMYSFISLRWIYIQDRDGYRIPKGLWSDCRPQCELLYALRAMACICVVGYLLTIGVGIFDNCRLVSPDYHSRKLEWTALFTGTVGLCMDLIYMLVYYIRIWNASLEMDFAIGFAAILILFLGVTLIACKNRKPQLGGIIINSPQTMVVHYSQGQTQAFVPPVHANYVAGQNEPLCPPGQHPRWNPPPSYSLPPEYPGDCVKA